MIDDDGTEYTYIRRRIRSPAFCSDRRFVLLKMQMHLTQCRNYAFTRAKLCFCACDFGHTINNP